MELTMAINRYDRHIPLLDGTIAPPAGIDLKVLEVGESAPNRHGMHRHRRLLNDHEFDIGESSLASYITAIARDPDLPYTAIPIFPRRLFSMSQMYVNVDAGIESPADLIGRKVGIHAFQVTLSVLAKGDLKLEYGVGWEGIDWVCMNPEVIAIDLPKGVSIGRIPEGADIGKMLINGEIDALFSPQPRKSMLAGSDRVRRLFRETRDEEVHYFKKYGFYPIMHLMAVKKEVLRNMPELGNGLIEMFSQAKETAYEFYDDPNYSLLAWGRNLFEEQRAMLAADPWPFGLAANRKNLEQFIGYCHDQRLIEAPIPVEQLFDQTMLDS